MPLFVLAELRLGAARSHQSSEDTAMVDLLLARCHLIVPDFETIPFYVRVRNDLTGVRTVPKSIEKLEGFGHDLWIAALCIQNNLPLLTNDALFDQISDLKVIHW